jgi:hypothetical protein
MSQSNDVKFIGVIEILELNLPVFPLIIEEANYIQIAMKGFLSILSLFFRILDLAFFLVNNVLFIFIIKRNYGRSIKIYMVQR